jgi:hypothetical protein
MAQSFHINGAPLVQFGPGGSISGSLTDLGIATEDGVRITVNNYDFPVMTDDGGTAAPKDIQDMGRDAIITIPLVFYDLAALTTLRSFRGTADGNGRDRGKLTFTSGYGFRLVLTSPTDEAWRFFWCTLRGPNNFNVGTVRTIQNLTVNAFELPLAAKGAGWWLYDHTAA